MQLFATFGVTVSGGEAAATLEKQDLWETQHIIRFDEIHFLDGF